MRGICSLFIYLWINFQLNFSSASVGSIIRGRESSSKNVTHLNSIYVERQHFLCVWCFVSLFLLHRSSELEKNHLNDTDRCFVGTVANFWVVYIPCTLNPVSKCFQGNCIVQLNDKCVVFLVLAWTPAVQSISSNVPRNRLNSTDISMCSISFAGPRSKCSHTIVPSVVILLSLNLFHLILNLFTSIQSGCSIHGIFVS